MVDWIEYGLGIDGCHGIHNAGPFTVGYSNVGRKQNRIGGAKVQVLQYLPESYTGGTEETDGLSTNTYTRSPNRISVLSA